MEKVQKILSALEAASGLEDMALPLPLFRFQDGGARREFRGLSLEELDERRTDHADEESKSPR
jgi:hypothetical protein